MIKEYWWKSDSGWSRLDVVDSTEKTITFVQSAQPEDSEPKRLRMYWTTLDRYIKSGQMVAIDIAWVKVTRQQYDAWMELPEAVGEVVDSIPTTLLMVLDKLLEDGRPVDGVEVMQ